MDSQTSNFNNVAEILNTFTTKKDLTDAINTLPSKEDIDETKKKL